MQMKRRGIIKVKLGKDQNKTSLQQATRHEEPGLIFTWGLCIAESTNFANGIALVTVCSCREHGKNTIRSGDSSGDDDKGSGSDGKIGRTIWKDGWTDGRMDVRAVWKERRAIWKDGRTEGRYEKTIRKEGRNI
jgi:hypothetical protein